MLLDCISQLTETKDKFRGLPLGARAIHIADGNTSTYFLTTFGRAKRETVCSCEVDTQPTLSQALHLINGDAVDGKIRQGKAIEKLLDAGKKPHGGARRAYDPLPVPNAHRRRTNETGRTDRRGGETGCRVARHLLGTAELAGVFV